MSRRGGQALVPVLFIVLILTAWAVVMAATARREVRASSAYSRDLQAFYIARGAMTYAGAELQQVTGGGAAVPQLTVPPETDANGWTPLGEGWYRLEIIDTTSRLNINTADLQTLAKLPALQADPSIAAAIVDWRDADDTPTVSSNGSGAESDYYEALTPSYSAKNAPFDTVDELMLVRGVTPALLYGAGGQTPNPLDGSTVPASGPAGRSARSRQDAGPSPGAGSGDAETPAVDTSESTVPLAEMITTYSRELNVASDGTARLNLKTAAQEQLQSQLGISQSKARSIYDRRSQITSIGELLGNPLSRADLQRIGDKITVTSDQYRNGVININTAPAEVLAALPGVDATVYNAIIEARNGGTVFSGMNDLFQLTNLNRQQLQALVDHVCTKSSSYLVRVKVRMPGTARVYAYEALMDLAAPQQQAAAPQSDGAGQTADTEPAPALLQWREVGRSPGWSNWISPTASASAEP